MILAEQVKYLYRQVSFCSKLHLRPPLCKETSDQLYYHQKVTSVIQNLAGGAWSSRAFLPVTENLLWGI
jgi:hypothetical protein